jgi:hypothetical protein
MLALLGNKLAKNSTSAAKGACWFAARGAKYGRRTKLRANIAPPNSSRRASHPVQERMPVKPAVVKRKGSASDLNSAALA